MENNNLKSEDINFSNNNYFEDNIDLLKILKIISRKKIILIPIATIGFSFSLLYAKLRPPIWEGQFQIVLETDKGTSNKYDQLMNNQIIASLTNTKSNSLKTEVKILESPSILQPVFNFVKEEKLKFEPNKKYNSTYTSWAKNSLEIRLEPETSVLNIKYQDKDKSLILPVLTKISNAYQNYSARDNQRSISQGIKYLEEQITKVRIESNIALSNMQEFASKNLIGNEQGLPLSAPFLTNANRIDSFPYDAQSNERQLSQVNKLRTLESKLVEMSAVLTPESSVIKSLNEKINAYKKSLSRPKEVLLEFRNLQRITNIKERLLLKLETEIAALKLEKARQTDPWELISKPTLFNNPAGTSSKIIILIGTSIAILFGSLAAIIYEKISGKLYEVEDFVKVLQIPLLKILPNNKSKLWTTSIDLISGNILDSNHKGDLALILISQNNSTKECKNIYERFKKNLNSSQKKVLLTSNLLEAKQYLIKILICISGKITYNELYQIKQDIDLQNSDIKGFIFIDN